MYWQTLLTTQLDSGTVRLGCNSASSILVQQYVPMSSLTPVTSLSFLDWPLSTDSEGIQWTYIRSSSPRSDFPVQYHRVYGSTVYIRIAMVYPHWKPYINVFFIFTFKVESTWKTTGIQKFVNLWCKICIISQKGISKLFCYVITINLKVSMCSNVLRGARVSNRRSDTI